MDFLVKFCYLFFYNTVYTYKNTRYWHRTTESYGFDRPVGFCLLFYFLLQWLVNEKKNLVSSAQTRPDYVDGDEFKDMMYLKIQEASVVPGEPVGQ
jgi:hypothetical protein